MKMKSLFLMLSTVLVSSCWLQAREKPAATKANDVKKAVELARYAKAFIGAGNVSVEVAPYKSGTEERAILLIKGVEGAWDGQAIDHAVQPASQGGKQYLTQYNGKSWVTLRYFKDSDSWVLYVPDVSDDIHLAPSDGGAQLTTPQQIYQTYLDQQKGRH